MCVLCGGGGAWLSSPAPNNPSSNAQRAHLKKGGFWTRLHSKMCLFQLALWSCSHRVTLCLMACLLDSVSSSVLRLHSSFYTVIYCQDAVMAGPRSGELRMQKLKSHLVRTQSLNVLPFKPGLGQYIAIHATLTAREFFLAYFYPSSPFTCIFSKTSQNFFLCWPAE